MSLLSNRKIVVEASKLTRNVKSNRPKWKVIETVVRDNVAVEVSELPLPIPRFSFRVGNAHFDQDTKAVSVGPRVTVFNFREAAKLLEEVGSKYEKIREDRIEEVESLKAKFQTYPETHTIVMADPDKSH